MVKSFKMTEIMEGYHEPEPGKRLPIKFEAEWGPPNMDMFLDYKDIMFLTCIMKGKITAEGLCKNAKLDGLLYLHYHKGTIIYEFTFNEGGKTYLFTGEKVNIRPWNVLTSHTTCYFTIVDAYTDVLVSRGVVFFKLKNVLSFIKSLRIEL